MRVLLLCPRHSAGPPHASPRHTGLRATHAHLSGKLSTFLGRLRGLLSESHFLSSTRGAGHPFFITTQTREQPIDSVAE